MLQICFTIEALNYDAMFMVGITKQSSDEDWEGHAWAVVSIPGEDNLGTYYYGDCTKSQTKFYFVEATAYYDGTSTSDGILGMILMMRVIYDVE